MTLYPSLPYPLRTYCIMTYFSLFLVTTFLTFLLFSLLRMYACFYAIPRPTSYLRPRLPIVRPCSILMFITILILGTLLPLLVRVVYHFLSLGTTYTHSHSHKLCLPAILVAPHACFRIPHALRFNAHNSTTPAPNTPLKFTRFPRNKPLALSRTCTRMQHVPNVNIFLASATQMCPHIANACPILPLVGASIMHRAQRC